MNSELATILTRIEQRLARIETALVDKADLKAKPPRTDPSKGTDKPKRLVRIPNHILPKPSRR